MALDGRRIISTPLANALDVRILGPFEVWRDNAMLELGRPQQQAVLAILVVHANEVVSSDRIVDELWQGDPPPSARHTLQTHVSRLRRALEPAVPSKGHYTRLASHRAGYVLQLAEDEIDSNRAAALIDRGRRLLIDGQPEEASLVLKSALGLWRGSPLMDFQYYDFAQGEIIRHEELRLSAIEDCVAAELAMGNHHEIVGELEALTAAHPHRDRIRSQLMTTLYRCGRQTEALSVYQDIVEVLADQLGLVPGPDLQDLEQRILRHDKALLDPIEQI